MSSTERYSVDQFGRVTVEKSGGLWDSRGSIIIFLLLFSIVFFPVILAKLLHKKRKWIVVLILLTAIVAAIFTSFVGAGFAGLQYDQVYAGVVGAPDKLNWSFDHSALWQRAAGWTLFLSWMGSVCVALMLPRKSPIEEKWVEKLYSHGVIGEREREDFLERIRLGYGLIEDPD